MGRVVVITHEFDVFAFQKAGRPIQSHYLLFGVLKELEAMGHSRATVRGPVALPGDLAILHVDATIVDPEYLALAAHYPRTVNFGTADISKRVVSRILLEPGDDWGGQVVVKSNLNNRASKEDWHNEIARRNGRPLPHPGISQTRSYELLPGLAAVPDDVWADPTLVVERFMPEEDDSGYALRTWVFMGPRERCNRMVTPGPVSKAADVVKIEPVQVPPEIRAERERLNFDFGKFDFVIHDGTPVLLDANRTPGVGTAIQEMLDAGARNLAEGLDALLKEPAHA